LIEEEIKFWRELDLSGSEDYIDNMIDILKEAKKCSKGLSCVLRIGHGSGWRFITGAWAESLHNFNRVVNISRPMNNNYLDYPFPKTRRIDEDSDLLGFVKLSYE
jgi:CRISPR/Cas system CSM-associated protein Csm5 (group 7 of RAMP superfamily)